MGSAPVNGKQAGNPPIQPESALAKTRASAVDLPSGLPSAATQTLYEQVPHESERRLRDELEATRQLQAISTELIGARGTEALYEKIVDAAVFIMRSDFASMQMFHPERGNGGELNLLAFRGFNPQAAKFWEWVRTDSESTCGAALRTGKRVIAADVTRCKFMAGSADLETYLQTGIHAVQTTPLISRSGGLLGMLSTHWREPHEPSESDLQRFDVLARQAADLIERSQAEQAVRQSMAQTGRQRRLYEGVLTTTPDLAYVFDLDHRFVYANEGLLRMWGKTWDEAIGKNCLELGYEPWHAAMHDREIEQVIATKRPIRGEVPFTGTFGRRIYDYIFTPVLNERGEVEAIAGTTRDITEHKQREEELHVSEERFRAFVTTTADVVYRMSADWSELRHLDGKEFIADTPEPSRTWLDKYIHPDDQPHVMEVINKAIQEKSAFQLEHRVLRIDGTLGWTFSRAIPLLDEKGEISEWFGTASDVTERKRAEESLRRSETDLRARNEELARFNRAAVGREMRMIELKKEINDLCRRLGEPARYPLEFEREEREHRG